jgi:hypothetical protein
LVVKNYNLDTPLDSAAVYINQAQTLSRTLGFENGNIDSDYALAHLVLFTRSEQARRTILSALARSQQRHDEVREALGLYLLGCTYDGSLAQQPRRVS